ncbi:type I-E CRISPR-associated protein Cse2/CasB [Streptomyces sp. NPDC004609]|uniref:type I-E CRISPR-associated protein Cse2/CasB n=1 Tax=Streptomyces sp. NPDC004609 TaxID=3364704 RepID=UPI0036B2AE4A
MSTATTGPASLGDGPPGSRQPSLEAHDRFVAAVSAECRVPGSQQALRRALGKPVDEIPARTHAVLLRNGLVPDTAKGDARRAHYAMAALIAARPGARRESGPDAEPPRSPEPGGEAADTRTTADSGRTVGTGTRAGSGTTAGPGTADGTGTTAGTGSAGTASESFRPGGTNLGESLALAAVLRHPDLLAHNEPGADPHRVAGLESRLHLMVRQDVDGLHRMLPGVLRQLGSAGVPVDHGCLLKDLIAWTWYRDSVATRWLTEYYRTVNRERAAAQQKKRKPDSPARE